MGINMKRSSFNIMSRLIVLVASLLPLMLLAVVLGVLGFFCAIFITVFGGFALLNVLEFSVPIGIGMIFVCVIVFAVLRGILHYGEQACNHYIAFKLLALIRDKVFKALRRLAPAKLDGKDKGNLITILTTDIELLEVFYAHTISPIAIAVIVSVVMSIFVGQYHISQGFLTCIGYVVVGIFIPVYASKKNKKNSEEFRDKFGDMNSFYLDSLRGLKEIIQYGIGGLRLRELDQRTDELSEKEKRLKKNSATNSAVTSMAILLFSMIMLFLSVYLYGQGHVSFDGVLIPTIAMMSSFGPVIALANLGTGLTQTLAAGNRVMDVLDEMPVTLEVTNKTNIMFDGVVCEDVSFSYGDEKVLEDVSIRVPQGQVIGITGKSGSGKSTLLRLLMHFWNTEKGKVMISNTDIREINTDNLRDLESFVTQETQMFSDSIENNLKIAKLDASHNEIIQSCKKASIHDFIMTLPNGYDTKVGELGETLSGGERQRLGVARAFLHDAPLILLDEPTSNLDSLNEAVILKSLVEKRKDKTVILVSHRISTMKIADQSYSVENGRMS